ncbi:MAG: SGNH/GDSL hydrolase family protein [Acidobacteriota bacterium]
MTRLGRILRAFMVNVVVFLALWTVAEVTLQWSGVKPLGRIGEGDPRTLRFCEACSQGTLKLTQNFFTGADGIFRADPRYFSGPGKSWAGGIRINSDGFRGNELIPPPAGERGVLLIGDSFTWGATAEPIEMSFADRLGRAGYHIYNGGIPGTDVAHYRRVAEKFVPLVRPHAVVVCIYEGNDFAPAPQPVKANRNQHIITNAGYLSGYDLHGRFFSSSEEGITYWKRARCGIYRHPGDWITYRTLLGRILDRLFRPSGGVPPDLRRGWIRLELRAIARLCAVEGCDFLILVIPQDKEANNPFIGKREYVQLFEGMPYFIPEAFSPGDYSRPPDRHFNNEGHRKFAELTQRILTERGHHPSPAPVTGNALAVPGSPETVKRGPGAGSV